MLYIFDWDGTLADSVDKIVKTMQRACKELDLETLKSDQIKNIIGLGLLEAIKTLYPEISEEKSEQLKRSYSRHFLAKEGSGNIETVKFFPGVLSTLKQLKDQGHRLAVATGKSRAGLNRILAELDMQHFFDASRCADETASKPNPKMLNELLVEFNVNANEALMVGDTEWDMDMARLINMPRIAVTYGAHTEERLLQFSPLRCIDSFEELLTIDF